MASIICCVPGSNPILTLAVALGFLLASAWIRQTMERSRIETDRLYDTTVVSADILLADPTKLSTEETPTKGMRLCLPEDHRQRLEQRLRDQQCSRGGCHLAGNWHT